MTSPHSAPVPATDLPLVVQIGFAGTRKLYDAKAHPLLDTVAFETAVEQQFATLVDQELARLNLQAPLFLCGISSMAVGGDYLFTRFCQRKAILQRVYLPQPRDEFLNAQGSSGPDFSPEQQQAAVQLLTLPHIIQERIVSTAAERRDRFRDVNLEIVRDCDVLIALVQAEQANKPGGTLETVELAAHRNRPVLIVSIAVEANGQPLLTAQWERQAAFQRPALHEHIAECTLPKPVPSSPLPTIGEYTTALKRLASDHANAGRRRFVDAAIKIIGAHVLATVFAVVALKFHAAWVLLLLAVELFMLQYGLRLHKRLHDTHSVRRWAMTRLVAEIARSVGALGKFHIHLDYLYALPFPPQLKAVLHTIQVLHLNSTQATRHATWNPTIADERTRYVVERLTRPKDPATGAEGQVSYNSRTEVEATRKLKRARRIFYGASGCAILATVLKLLLASTAKYAGLDEHLAEVFEKCSGYIGLLAVVLPVLAVAALSLATAFDLEARESTSSEMLVFLEHQVTLLNNANSIREYSQLLLETEARLLGETVNWYARRSFLGVS